MRIDVAVAPTKSIQTRAFAVYNKRDMSDNESYEHGKPTDGMCCLCTMEDITDEDQNYGTFYTSSYYGTTTMFAINFNYDWCTFVFGAITVLF